MGLQAVTSLSDNMHIFNLKSKSKTFYTVHPSGIIRRYNPDKSKEIPQGSGNDLINFGKPFRSSREYAKGLKYLKSYIERKEERKDYR